MLAAGPQLQLPTPTWLGTRSELATGIEFARSWSGTRDWQLAEHAVRGGDPVATVGSSGGSGQAGLYFELRHQGRPIDPLGWSATR
jgi:hypothetical protein